MNVYEVIATNIDVNDGEFVHTLYSNLKSATNNSQAEVINKNPKNIVEDFEGKLSEYDGKSLEYTASKGRPAIYYRSHYGNYRCVVYVKTRIVYS